MLAVGLGEITAQPTVRRKEGRKCGWLMGEDQGITGHWKRHHATGTTSCYVISTCTPAGAFTDEHWYFVTIESV